MDVKYSTVSNAHKKNLDVGFILQLALTLRNDELLKVEQFVFYRI